MAPTDRTQVRRLPERAAYDRALIDEILDAGLVAHVGIVVDGTPHVIPTLHGRLGDTLFIHGSPAAGLLRNGPSGEMCVTVTAVDGLVLARSAFHHSLNYRSVVVFGRPRPVTEPDEKVAALRAISEHVLPGRWDEVRAPSVKELRATTVLALDLDEASAKVRTGPPIDDDEDLALPIWSGVLPLTTIAGTPDADPTLLPGVAVSPSVQRAAGAARPSSMG